MSDIKNEKLNMAEAEVIRRERLYNNAWHKFLRNKGATTGLAVMCVIVLLALFAPLIVSYDPNTIDLMNPFLSPGESGHIFGTDEVGRDLFARILYGGRTSVLISFGATLMGAVSGIALGLIAGFAGGAVDSVIMRIVDGMFAFPYILLSILLMTILGSGSVNVVLALGISAIPRFARVVRGQVIIIKHEEYCNAERVLGASGARIAIRHILPNAISPIVVYATLNFANAIIGEASLSFLGLGITPPTASWGGILRTGKSYLATAPHIATIAGIFILLTVIALNLIGDGIRDIMDPKMKR